VTTGDDCDDAGIADERFASPEGGYLFNATIDNDNRKSLGSGGGGFFLSSQEDKVFSGSNNFD